MTFRVGQKVECIRESRHPEWVGPVPALGDIFTVGWVGDETIDLVEMPSPEDDEWVRGWLADHFRPIVSRSTSIAIFTAMLNPSQVTVDALNIADFARESAG